MIRERDWSGHPLGSPETWPTELRTALSLVLNSPESMILAWGPGLHFFFNETYFPLLGPRLAWAMGERFDVVWADAWEQAKPIIDDAFAGRSQRFTDLPWKLDTDRGAAETWFTFSYSRVLDAEGRVAGLFIFTNETTERVLADRRRHEAEAELRAERDRAQGVLDNMGEAFALLDGDLRIVDVNAEAMRMELRPREALIGCTHVEAYPDADSELERLYRKALRDHVPVSREHRYVWPDGRATWIDMRAYPVEGGLAVFYRDVTERRAAVDALREREARLTALVTASSESLYSMSPDWGELRQLSGGSFLPDTLSRNPAWLRDYIPTDEQAWVREAIAKAVTTKKVFELEHRVRRADGTTGWAHSRAVPLFDEAGAITEWFGAAGDVTEKHRVEEELRTLNADLERQVVERSREHSRTWQVSSDLLGILDGRGHFIRSNPAWQAVLGWSTEELTREPHAEFVHPDDRAATLEAFEQLIDGISVPRFENRYRTKSGGYRWLSWMAVPEEGAVYCSARDVTVEKEQAAKLEERTTEMRHLWDTSPDLLLVIDFEGVFRRVNPAWTRLLGYAPMELVGHHVSEFVLPDDTDRTRAAYEEAAAGRSPTVENRYRHKDGSTRHFSWVAVPVGGLTYATGRDVTAQRQAEEELAAAQEALRQSQKLEAVGQLTGGVAHDFNNLLTIIRSSVDFLRRPELAEERKARYLNAVSETVDRAAKLTGQLLAFARRQTLKPEILDVGARLRPVAELLDTVTGARITVTTHLPDHPCFVSVDLSQFETALVNMAVNARDAMDGEGTLTLRLECGSALPPIRGHAGNEGPFAAISLHDTGSGIAQDAVARIFEPFFTTKEVGKGTGLGLSQVFGFAKQSGGDVEVESKPGWGTTFTLYLPQVAPGIAVREEEAEAEPSDPGGAGQRVLVVEDNVEVGRFATQILEDLGYKTTWAVNAEDALDLLGGNGAGFDVVFSDVVMPGMGGIELARLLKGRMPDLPVVLASGYSHVLAEESSTGFELLQKPYSADQVSRILRKVARGKRARTVPR